MKMFLIQFLVLIAELIHFIVSIYIIIIFIACILSFVNPDPNNKLVRIIYTLTNPAFRLVKRFIPTVFGGIDISPIIIWFVLILIDRFVPGLILYAITLL